MAQMLSFRVYLSAETQKASAESFKRTRKMANPFRLVEEVRWLHHRNHIICYRKPMRYNMINFCSMPRVLDSASSPRADLRWNRKLEDMVELTKLQDELLDSASKLVKHGGVLIYSIEHEENEGRVEAFILRHPEFSIDPVTSFAPSSFVTSQGFFLSNPVKQSLDGAFAARLVRAL